MRMWKRTLSFLMAVFMVVSMLPVAAYAEDGELEQEPAMEEIFEVEVPAEAVAFAEEETEAAEPAEEAEEAVEETEAAEEATEAVEEVPAETEPAEEVTEAVEEVPAETEPAEEVTEAVEEVPAETEPAEEATEPMEEVPAETEPAEEVTEAVEEVPAETEPAEEATEAVEEVPAETEPAEEATEPVEEVPAETEPAEEATEAVEEVPAETEEAAEPEEILEEEPDAEVSEDEPETQAEEVPSATRTEAGLRKFLAEDNDAFICISDEITLTSDLTISKPSVSIVDGGKLIVPAGVHLTISASLHLGGGSLVVYGSYSFKSDYWYPAVYVNLAIYGGDVTKATNLPTSDLDLSANVSTTAELAEICVVADSYRNSEISIIEDVNLPDGLTIGKQTGLYIENYAGGCTVVTVPAGAKVNNNGQIFSNQGGKLVIDGEILNKGFVGNPNGGDIVVNGKVTGVPLNTWGYGADFVTTEEELREAVAKRDWGTITPLGDITLTSDLLVRECTISLTPGAKLTVPQGVTLTNIGTIRLNGGTLTVNGNYERSYQENGIVYGGQVMFYPEQNADAASATNLPRLYLSVYLDTPASTADLKAAIAKYADTFCEILVDFFDSYTIDEYLEVPNNVMIDCYGWKSPNVMLTVAEGVTIVNAGQINIWENATLNVLGQIENHGFVGSGYNGNVLGAENITGIPWNSRGYVDPGMFTATTEEELRVGLGSNYYAIRIEGDITLTKDMDMHDHYISIPDGGSLTVSQGVTLTNTCQIKMDGGKLIVNGRYVNTVRTEEGWFRSGFVCINPNFYSHPSEATNLGKDFLMMEREISSMEDVKHALAVDPALYNFVHLYFEGGFTISEDITIPENVSFYFNAGYGADDTTVLVPADVTVTNFGTIVMGERTILSVRGIINNYGFVGTYNGGTVKGSENIKNIPWNEYGSQGVNQVYTEQELRDAIEQGKRNITIAGDITLTQNLNTTNSTWIEIGEGGTLHIPKGITATIYAYIELRGGYLDVQGAIRTNAIYKASVQSEFYEKVSDATNLNPKDILLVVNTDNVDELKAAFTNSEVGVIQAHVETDLVIDQNLTIPANAEMITWFNTITVTGGATLTNNGTLNLSWGTIGGVPHYGYMDVLSDGTFVNNGTMYIMGGGFRKADGKITLGDNTYFSMYNGQADSMKDRLALVPSALRKSISLSRSCYASNGDQATEQDIYDFIALLKDFKSGNLYLDGQSITLSKNMTIPQNMGLNLSESSTLVIPKGITLTVDGSLNAYVTSLTVEGTLVSNGYCAIITDEGNEGTVYWELTDSGELSLYGPGELPNYTSTSYKKTPWYGKQITSLVLYNVSSIGSKAFADMTSLKTIELYGTDTAIASDAFTGVTAKVYYEDADANVGKNFGGTLTWVNRNAKLVIKTQPESQSGIDGKKVYFNVEAEGFEPTYQWQYKAAGSSSWKNLSSGTAAKLSVSATLAKNGYQYRCKITDGNGNTVTSNTVKLTVTLPAPVISSVANAKTGVTVKWGAVTNATKYTVYYKTSTGSYKTAGSTTSTSYTVTGLTSGTKYTFAVRACTDNSAEQSSRSSTKSLTYVAAPALPTVANTTTGVKVTWTAVKGAVNYRVMYKTSSGSWKTAGTSTGTSLTVTGLTSGTKYYFTVRCVNKDNTEAVSSYDSTGKSITYIAAPTVSAVANTTTGVKVTWGSVKGAVNYRVMYKTSGGSWKTAGTTTGTSLTVKGLTSGTKYYFTVRCVNKDNTATTSSYNSTGKSITYIAAPALPTVSNTRSGVKVTWTAVPGAAKYRVYYKTTGGSWTKAGDTTSTSYTVKNLRAGTKYYFTVACVSSDGAKLTSAYNTTGKALTTK